MSPKRRICYLFLVCLYISCREEKSPATTQISSEKFKVDNIDSLPLLDTVLYTNNYETSHYHGPNLTSELAKKHCTVISQTKSGVTQATISQILSKCYLMILIKKLLILTLYIS